MANSNDPVAVFDKAPRFFVSLDANGRPTGLYRSDFGAAPPDDAVEISEEDWKLAVTTPPDRIRREGNRLFADPVPPLGAGMPLSITKLGLVRTLRERGQWDAVKAAIASDPDVQEDWDLATEIRRTDPLVPAVVAAMGYSEADVDAIMARAEEIVR